MRRLSARKISSVVLLAGFLLTGCIPPDNPVIDGDGTPDIASCGVLDDVQDGRNYAAQSAGNGQLYPDIFYIGWSSLDTRNDLRFPARGYSGDGFEDKLLVSRETAPGSVQTWQLLPMLTQTCEDEEKIRIHSFDITPDGRSLYISMRRTGDAHLGIYEFDFKAYTFRKITSDDGVDFLYPTYVGDDPNGNRIFFVSRSVYASEIPMNYGGPTEGVLLDEYDRAPTPLIHTLNVETGAIKRIRYNNSHQLDPIAIRRPDGTHLVVFTQWEHQQTTNRFSLWKIQVDGSDNFTFYGQESAIDRSAANVFQPREIKSGPYAGYLLMTQGRSGFIADGSIVMTHRDNLGLRSDRIVLERYEGGLRIARNPDHYDSQSFVYAYRDTIYDTYGIYVKNYPGSLGGDTTTGAARLIKAHNDLHFVQPRSYYPPPRGLAAPSEGSVGESRTSFTNTALNGRAGFLVQDLTQSDNGVQHQLDGIDPKEVALQFFIPSQTISGSSGSQTVGRLDWSGSPELSVPASGFLRPEDDGSLAATLKPGLYVWKLNKRFDHNGTDLWIPIRAERQEISFVPNRVNACNQCHQERSQANIDLYENKATIASQKIQSSNLSDVYDVSTYNAYDAVPDFHRDIMPLLASCGGAGCHDARDKLDLSNDTGWRSENSTWLALVRGGHKLTGTEDVVPYIYNSINPTGFDDNYHPAPFLWSLMLGDDLSEAPEAGFPNGSSRVLTRSGDYSATHDSRIESAIATINSQYDHAGAWTSGQLQQFITYSSTQSMVGLTDRITFAADSLSTSTPAAQKAYQAMVRVCFDCHNNHATAGIDDPNFGLPLENGSAVPAI